MKKEWKNIDNFPGYQVSNFGEVRSCWKRKHYPKGFGSYNYMSNEWKIMSQSDDGNGYMKVTLYKQGDRRRYCKKVHRLVAESFIFNPNPEYLDTVDHIKSGIDGKLDNSINNLRWMSRRENIQKAYKDGMCDERIMKSNKPIIAINLLDNTYHYFKSIQEASNELKIERSTISHILARDIYKSKNYTFYEADREEILCYGIDDEYQMLPWIQLPQGWRIG